MSAEELRQLQKALEDAIRERTQAAEYGLQVLEEKQQYEYRCQELEAQVDTLRHECETAKEELRKVQAAQKRANKTGEQHEESLIEESLSREEALTERVSRLERELNAKTKALEEARAEIERLTSLHSDTENAAEQLDAQKRRMIEEIRHLKQREQTLVNDYGELEDENITLQKQVASLKRAQIEYETMRYEVKRLLDETEVLQAQNEEVSRLKQIAVSQVEEALQNLQHERELRLSLKKELDALKRQEESMQRQYPMFMSIYGGLDEAGVSEKIREDADVVRTMEASYYEGDDAEGPSLLDEVKDASSDALSRANQAKEALEKEIARLNSKLDAATEALAPERQAELLSILETLKSLDGKDAQSTEQKLAKAIEELSKLRQRTSAGGPNAALSAEAEKHIQAKNREIRQLEDDLRAVAGTANDTATTLAIVQDSLIGISESLAQLYHHVHIMQDTTPDRVMLEHMKKIRDSVRAMGDELPTRELESGTESGTDTDMGRSPRITIASATDRRLMSEHFINKLKNQLSSEFRNKLQVDDVLSTSNEKAPKPEDKPVCHVVQTVADQLKYLRRSIEAALAKAQDEKKESKGDGERSASDVQEELDELTQQNLKLRALLSTKREQIATLRTVLKSNKVTAENAMASLKQKYEAEKGVHAETAQRLRQDLKQFKEDAATFASLRAMYTARIEEYQAQVEDQQKTIKDFESEMKTLNSLLRMAIAQKVQLTQRIEELEMERERQSFQSSNRGHGAAGGGERNRGSRGGSRGGQHGQQRLPKTVGNAPFGAAHMMPMPLMNMPTQMPHPVQVSYPVQQPYPQVPMSQKFPSNGVPPSQRMPAKRDFQ